MAAPTRTLQLRRWKRRFAWVALAATVSLLLRPPRTILERGAHRRSGPRTAGSEAGDPAGRARNSVIDTGSVDLLPAPPGGAPDYSPLGTFVAPTGIESVGQGLVPPAGSPVGPGLITTASEPHAVGDGAGPRAIPDHGSRHTSIVTWLLIYALALVLPLALVVLEDEQAPRTFILELGSGLGIAALSMLAVQLALPARLPVLAAIGAEVAVRLHRRTADIMLALVAAHVAAVMVADPARLELLRFVGEPWRAQAAIGSVVALIVLALTSFLRRRLRLSYVAWRAIHLVTGALALVLAVVHTVGVGRYLVHGSAELLLVGLTIGGLGALVVMRGHWLRRRSVRPYEVEAVIPERGGAITLALRADGHGGQRFIPGQFAWLKLAGTRTMLAEHPFSYSSSAEDPARPMFTMQPRAGFTARVAELAPGTRLLLDGPHGAFRPRTSSNGTVLLAGGIGITPSMSILRTAADHNDPRPFVLFYGARTLDSMAFIDELEALSSRINLTIVPVLSSPSPEWAGERGRINVGVLDRHLPRDLRGWQFLACGSGQFVDAVVGALETIGVPGERVHAERFVDV